LASEYDLELVLKSNFHDFFYDKTDIKKNEANKHNMDLLNRIKVMDDKNTVSNDEWEVASNNNIIYLI